nr:lysoplasmalogenase [Aquisalibacillus elongatus]
MKNLLTWLIIISAILYIFIIPDWPLGIKLIFKVIPMILIIWYAFLKLPKHRLFVHYAVIIGLVFSAIGDVTLHWFIVGLSAFLIAHVFYLIGFLTQWRTSFVRSITIVPFIIYSYILGNGILQSITDNTLVIPVMVYIIVITAMAWAAVMARNVYAIIGALLFVISDSILAWNMFVTNVPYSGIWIMTTYYSAQFLIAHSILYFNQQSD